jgi:protoporphyrinogen oxidase
MKTCVIGGGLMGLALARKLARDGHAVTVLERAEQLGGLATWHDFGGFYWDRFYHVILPSDRHLIGFVDELGLTGNLEWQRTYTGFYVDDRMHSISSNLEFLKFPLLSLVSKARLAWTMLYCSRIDDWKSLENVAVEDWLIRVSGLETYQKLWKPLLLAKLGPSYQRVSAVFIWSYIKRLFSARDKSASAEHLGHVNGGYKLIFEKLQADIAAAGGTVRSGVNVSGVRPDSGGGLTVSQDDFDEAFDQVVCTSPVSVLRQIAAPELVDIHSAGDDVEYLGVVCVVIVSKAPLVPYYVVNIADESIPFTGMIGMSTVIDVKNTGGRYLTYLPKYVLSTDAELRRSDREIEQEFLAGVRKMLPEFDMSQIESVHVNRAFKVQPLQVLGYSSLVPQVRTRHPGFFVLNTSQFVNATLNNNEVIGAVNRYYDEYRQTSQQKAA